MADMGWTEFMVASFRNCRTNVKRQIEGEVITLDEIMDMLKDLRAEGQLEPAFARMGVLHHIPFFLKQYEGCNEEDLDHCREFPAHIDLCREVFFDVKKTTVHTMKQHIRSYPEYKNCGIILWDSRFKSLSNKDLRKSALKELKESIPYISGTSYPNDDEFLISCSSAHPIVINPQTLKQVYPRSSDDKVAIPGIKPIVDPVQLVRIVGRARNEFLQWNTYTRGFFQK